MIKNYNLMENCVLIKKYDLMKVCDLIINCKMIKNYELIINCDLIRVFELIINCNFIRVCELIINCNLIRKYDLTKVYKIRKIPNKKNSTVKSRVTINLNSPNSLKNQCRHFSLPQYILFWTLL